MKHLIASVSLLCILSAAIVAQTRRPPGSVSAPPPQKVEVAAEDEPLANFAEKGLPEPAPLGLRPSAELARSVAPRILRNDQNSLAVLTGALQKAGFHIIDTNQKILYRPTSTPIGAAFYDFEVAGMLQATALGFATTMDKLGAVIANGDPELTRLRFPELLLSDLRAARTSQDPQAQFIASLIFELGKGSSDLSTGSAAQARLNLIQASLVERVFLGDLMDAFETFTERNASLIPERKEFGRDGTVRYSPVSWVRSGPCEAISDVSTVAGIEGKVKKVAGKIFGKGSIPSFLTGPKDAIKERFESAAKGIAVLNVVMSYAKVIMANMNIQAVITVEVPSMPLIRTKHNVREGEERMVTAKFGIDFKNSETINCAGKAVKTLTGLSVGVPQDGPLKKVPVKWWAKEEGTGYSKFTEYPLKIEAVDEQRRDISKQVTNDLGENKIKLTGLRQKTNLEDQPVVPQAKKANLRVSVALENMDAKKDLPKLLGLGSDTAVDMSEGKFGPLQVLGMFPDMIAKIPLKTYKVDVPVRDWQPCSEDWGGYINYTKKVSKTVVVRASRASNGNSTGDGVRRIEREATVSVVLNPRTPEDIEARKEPRPADYRVRGLYREVFEGSREADPCCGPEEGVFATKFRTGEITNFAASFKGPFRLSFSGGDRDYSLGFYFFTEPFDAHQYDYTEILETNCPLEYQEESSKDSDFPMTLEDDLAPGRYGDRFVNPAGDLLQGTKTIPRDGSTTITWEWALARCKVAR